MDPNEAKSASHPTGPTAYTGGCHCGAVRFRAELDLSAGAGRCNCSICQKISATAVLIKPQAFELLAGEENLGVYEWGAKISRRFFCKTCGIHVFGRGHLEEVGGDYASVNLNCLDDVEIVDLEVHYWDGRHNHWEAGPRPTPWPVGAQANGA